MLCFRLSGLESKSKQIKEKVDFGTNLRGKTSLCRAEFQFQYKYWSANYNYKMKLFLICGELSM